MSNCVCGELEIIAGQRLRFTTEWRTTPTPPAVPVLYDPPGGVRVGVAKRRQEVVAEFAVRESLGVYVYEFNTLNLQGAYVARAEAIESGIVIGAVEMQFSVNGRQISLI